MYCANSVQLLNNYTNTYHRKAELLSSYCAKLCRISKQNYFITIQPNRALWTVQDGIDYLNELLPKHIPVIAIMEYNDRIKRKSNSYELLPTLHIHAIIPESHLVHLQGIVLYKDSKDLNKQKRALNTKQLHITGRKVFSDCWSDYVFKQTSNSFMPFNLNFDCLTDNSLSRRIYKKQIKMKPIQNTQSIYTILHLLYYGQTYSEVIKEKQSKRVVPPIVNLPLILIMYRNTLNVKSPIRTCRKYVPFLANAPSKVSRASIKQFNK